MDWSFLINLKCTPDPDYSEPKENPRSNDHIKRIYECGEGGHRNTIYWHKKEFLSASSPNSSESERPYMSTKYGRESQGEFDKF